MQVVEISLQCTLFQRWDGIRITYPNAKLSTEPILNVSRSANRWEGFKVCTSIRGPEKLTKIDSSIFLPANSALQCLCEDAEICKEGLSQ